MPLQAYFAAPREHGVGGELGAVVTDDHGWLAALGDQFVQLSHNPPPGDRCVGHRTQTLPGHVIDNIEHAEAPPRDQLVVHEITAPALVWQGKDRRRRLGADSTPARSEEHTSELQSLMRISYAVFCLKQNKTNNTHDQQ